MTPTGLLMEGVDQFLSRTRLASADPCFVPLVAALSRVQQMLIAGVPQIYHKPFSHNKIQRDQGRNSLLGQPRDNIRFLFASRPRTVAQNYPVLPPQLMRVADGLRARDCGEFNGGKLVGWFASTAGYILGAGSEELPAALNDGGRSSHRLGRH